MQRKKSAVYEPVHWTARVCWTTNLFHLNRLADVLATVGVVAKLRPPVCRVDALRG